MWLSQTQSHCSANTAWYDTTLGVVMWAGRLIAMVPVLAIAGSLGRKQHVPASGSNHDRPQDQSGHDRQERDA